MMPFRDGNVLYGEEKNGYVECEIRTEGPEPQTLFRFDIRPHPGNEEEFTAMVNKFLESKSLEVEIDPHQTGDGFYVAHIFSK